jgi:ADP-heptose:LPS heptosyltransferase
MVHTFADIARVLAPIDPFDALIPLPVSKEAQRRADLFLKQFVGSRRPLVGIQAGISPYNLSQRVWDLERFAAFADGMITDCGAAVVFTGSPEQAVLNQEIVGRMRQEAVNAGGELTMEETIALVSACDLFLSSDTGTLHIAAAQGVPTIGLHGPESSIRYGPFGPGNHAFDKHVPCSPCTHPEYGIIGGCAAKTCLRSIDPNEVLAKARAMLFEPAQYRPRVLDVGR